MGLTTTKSEGFSVCANRSQSHMCRATASAPVSLSPALRAAPSRWEGANDTRMVVRQKVCKTDAQAETTPFPSGRGAGGIGRSMSRQQVTPYGTNYD